MKTKILLASLSLLFLISCSSNNEETLTTHDIWLMGYKAFLPTSEKESCTTKFLFFSTEGSPKFITEAKRASNVIDFSNATDATYFLLKDEDKIYLENGETIHSVYSITVPASANSYKTVSLPIGRYLVCAVSLDFNALTRSRYFLKYCFQYIDVKERESELILSPVFPGDYSRYGLIPWTDWNDSFTYDWTL